MIFERCHKMHILH